MRNPLAIEALTDWLEKKPEDKVYNYGSCRGCLLYKYLKDIGLPIRSVSTKYWWDEDYITHNLPPGFDDISIDRPHTYGAALRRAKALIP